MRQHAPLILLVLAVALFVPSRFTNSIKSILQGLTVPLAWPINRTAGFAHRIIFSAGPVDDASRQKPRDVAAVYRENETLRVLAANLEGQIDQLRQRAEESERLGPLQKLSTRVRITGSDGGAGSDINLAATTFGKIELGQPVFTELGLVGRISRAGPGGSVVRLITHRSSRITGSFLRFVDDNGRPTPTRLAIDPAVAVGDGGDKLVIESLRLDQVTAAGLTSGRDWFVLDDPGWPMTLQRHRVGVVESITSSREAPLFAEVRIKPAGVLTQLSDVRVLTREAGR